MWFAALAAAASMGLGAAQARQQKKASKKNRDALKGLMTENDLVGQAALGDIQRAKTSLGAGFDKASQAAKGSFAGVRNQIRVGEKQAGAELESALMSRGSYNTALLSLARQGVRFNTAMQLTQLGAALSRQLGEIEMSRGRAMAGMDLATADQRQRTFGNKVGIQQGVNTSRTGGAAVGGFRGEDVGSLGALLDDIFFPKTQNKPATPLPWEQNQPNDNVGFP